MKSVLTLIAGLSIVALSSCTCPMAGKKCASSTCDGAKKECCGKAGCTKCK